jgi:peptide/nickel transport system permease protein
MQTTLPTTAAIPADDHYELRKHVTWSRFRKHKLALIGGIVFALTIVIAICAHWLAPWDPNFIDQKNWSGYPLAPGVAGHILGTDENGRDLLSRLIFGAQISLTVAIFAVAMEIVLGTVLGAVAGFYGGIIDFTIMRITDVVLSIPLLPLLLVLTAIVA